MLYYEESVKYFSYIFIIQISKFHFFLDFSWFWAIDHERKADGLLVASRPTKSKAIREEVTDWAQQGWIGHGDADRDREKVGVCRRGWSGEGWRERPSDTCYKEGQGIQAEDS